MIPRDDVRMRRAGQWVYVCGSDSAPLRLRLPEPARVGDEVGPADLPDKAVESLVRRGLLVPASEPLRRHPSFRVNPPDDAGVHVAGDGPLSALVAEYISAAGVSLAGAPTSDQTEPGVLVVDLTAPEELLKDMSELAVSAAVPVVLYASAGARAYWAVLRPPTTACPLCVSVRIRACRADRQLGSLGLRVTLGAGDDTHWPSGAATAAAVAHQAIRVLTAATDAAAAAAGTGPATLVELNLDDASITHHPLLHTPMCPACHHLVGGRPFDERAGRPAAVSLAESWERMQRAVDPLTGIVSGLAVIPPGDARTGVDCTVAWARGGTDTTWFSSVRASTVGGATKVDPLEARVCALGEILERYAAGIHRPEQFVRGSLAELGPAALDPRTLPLGSPREYTEVAGELAPYHPDLVIDWVRGSSLVTDELRYLPAVTVYVPYRAPHRGERLLHPNSTGLAAGSGSAHATHGGLLEVIERDAAAIYWYNRLRVPTLDWPSLPAGPARTILERIRARGVELLAKDITTDLGVPAVMLLGRFAADDHPVALCGFRADIDLHGALLGAGQELEHLLAMYHRSRDQGLTPVPDPAAEPRDIWDFATYYCHESRVGALDFMHGGPRRPVPDPTSTPRGHADAVEHLVTRLSDDGYDAITVDLTPIDVAECGVSVVRTVIPGLQPVSFHRRFRHLGGRRVFTAPVRMGARERELTEEQLNPDPIPLG